MIIYSSFTSGMEHIVAKILKKYAHICTVLPGAIIYEINDMAPVLKIPCFNNHFRVIQIKNGDLSPKRCVTEILRSRNKIVFPPKGESNTFRIMISDKNNFVSIDKYNKERLENMIARQTGLRVNRDLADEEFWLLKRSENLVLFMQRLYNHSHKAYDKILSKGELKPEVAYILNYLSSPSPEDVYLDPFSGSGALAYSRQKYFGPFKKMYIFDIDLNKTKKIQVMDVAKDSKCDVRAVDIFDIHTVIPSHTVTKVVTDPPWGYFEQIEDMYSFYCEMLEKLIKVTTNDADFIILTSREKDFGLALKNFNIINLQQHNILLSGKKATINTFKIRR